MQPVEVALLLAEAAGDGVPASDFLAGLPREVRAEVSEVVQSLSKFVRAFPHILSLDDGVLRKVKRRMISVTADVYEDGFSQFYVPIAGDNVMASRTVRPTESKVERGFKHWSTDTRVPRTVRCYRTYNDAVRYMVHDGAVLEVRVPNALVDAGSTPLDITDWDQLKPITIIL